MTKLNGLIALAVGALMLGPAQAQTNTAYDICMEATGGDEAECAKYLPPPPPPPPPEEEPPPPPAEEPPPPPPVEEPPPPPPAEEPPPPPPVEEPPPPPPEEEPTAGACANGRHVGHYGDANGNAYGHRCTDTSAAAPSSVRGKRR